MATKKAISKGYTINVSSWENDGDYNATNTIVVDTIEMAESIQKMCKTLFCSCNNGKNGIGNSSDLNQKIKNKISSFFKENPILLPDEFLTELQSLEEDDEEEYYLSVCEHWKSELLGYSDFYYCRVASTVEIFYSDKDIFLEQITFK